MNNDLDIITLKTLVKPRGYTSWVANTSGFALCPSSRGDLHHIASLSCHAIYWVHDKRHLAGASSTSLVVCSRHSTHGRAVDAPAIAWGVVGKTDGSNRLPRNSAVNNQKSPSALRDGSKSPGSWDYTDLACTSRTHLARMPSSFPKKVRRTFMRGKLNNSTISHPA